MKHSKVLGLMSGTSMDGLDCGLFDIVLTPDYQLEWKIYGFKTFAYTEEIRSMINISLTGEKEVIHYVNEQLGQVFVSFTKQFLNNRNIDLIASHGQTIAHENGISTTQIGNPYYMYKEYGPWKSPHKKLIFDENKILNYQILNNLN